MSGTILENLSGRKLFILVTFLTLCQITCFLVGGLIAPQPQDIEHIYGPACEDFAQKNETKWYYNRGRGKCDVNPNMDNLSDNDLVYVFQMPVPHEGKSLKYSRWQQNLIGILKLDIFQNNSEVETRKMVTIDARLGYRNEGDTEDEWKLYAQSSEIRNLDCFSGQNNSNCLAVPLFELGCLSHDYYLLNIRLPIDNDTNYYKGQVQSLRLTLINQNETYTKVWVSLKTVFFPSFIAVIIWFWRRMKKLQRKFVPIETMLISLSVTLCFLNTPLEYLNLYFDLSLLLLIADIRQMVFYAKIFSFWLIFVGEHMLIQPRSSFKQYWAHILVVVMGCILLFTFDICERGIQLKNPFYSIWVSYLGFNFNLALTFLILSRILIGLYILFLCHRAWQVFNSMYHKRRRYISTSSKKLHYEGITFRFKVLLLVSMVCAALTLIVIILGQIAEWKLDENIKLEKTSAFFAGVYGMWNIYVFALLVFYAPSQKQRGGEIATVGLQAAK